MKLATTTPELDDAIHALVSSMLDESNDIVERWQAIRSAFENATTITRDRAESIADVFPLSDGNKALLVDMIANIKRA